MSDIKTVLSYLETVIDNNSEEFNTGGSALSIIVNHLFDQVEKEGLALDPGWLEGRLFALSVPKENKLSQIMPIDEFLDIVTNIDIFIADYFRKAEKPSVSRNDDIFIEVSQAFENVGDEKREYTLFTYEGDGYTFIVKVRPATGYREAFINNEYLFTKAGGLEINDLRYLTNTHYA